MKQNSYKIERFVRLRIGICGIVGLWDCGIVGGRGGRGIKDQEQGIKVCRAVIILQKVTKKIYNNPFFQKYYKKINLQKPKRRN